MGSASYSKQGKNTKCDVTLYFQQNADSASFYFKYYGFCQAYFQPAYDKYAAYYAYYGNSTGSIRMDVDGVYTGGPYTYAKSKSAGSRTSGSGWILDKEGTSSTVTLPAKNTGYNVTIRWTGNFSETAGQTVTYTFNLPIYINPNGTIEAVTKAYLNVGGIIKECTVYLNVNGTIKELT